MPPAILESDVELSTPTGVAILKALSPAFVDAWPVGVVRAQGMGAGSRSFDGYPNVFRIALFDAHPEGSPSLPYEYDSVVEICCNLDDETPERTAWLAATALEMGALDVWTTPVVGKKGRAAVTLSLLVAPADLPRVGDWLLRRSSTFGLRYSTWDRLKLSREVEIVETPRGQVSVQVGSTTDGEILKSKPEHDDLARIWAEDPDFEFRGPDTVTGE
ncbi:MAG: DUF111 family protein [Gemmatimonadetes bacterium]|nr:DUF111 family protein [Gemmatimonadota bacterium]